MLIQTFKRHEIKFKLNRRQYECLQEPLMTFMEYDKNCRENKSYLIYNIYFDTEDDEVIRRSLEKPYYKEKLRARAYRPLETSDSKVFLELKKKINGIVAKRRVLLPYQDVLVFVEEGVRPQVETYQDAQVITEIEGFLSRHPVYPKVYISYERSAFLGKEDKDFRISFDKQILTRREEVSLLAGDYGQELLEEDMYLMEVKCTSAIPSWLTTLLSELKVYKTSFSKYGTEYKAYYAEHKQERQQHQEQEIEQPQVRQVYQEQAYQEKDYQEKDYQEQAYQGQVQQVYQG